MFKYLANLVVPHSGPRIMRKAYHGDVINKIRLFNGSVFDLGGSVQVLTFFINDTLQWDGPLNHTVLAAAGPQLGAYIDKEVDHPNPGDVWALPGFDTPFDALFMAVLEEWDGGIDFRDSDMVQCYRRAVKMAGEKGMTSLVFPAMGRDKRDFPHIRFARLALKGITEGLAQSPTIEQVSIACMDKRMLDTYTERLSKMGWKAPAA